ncbi:MAG: hypothetical protein ACYTFI_02400 [Planctomycetota bacterium]
MEAPPDLGGLRVLGGGYPRAYFFRSAEGWAANQKISYERWEACFSRLMGIEGKVLDEEVPGRARRNAEFFARFKRAHPDQLVLLHYNGNARDPRYQTGKYFAGHWIYYNGARILARVPAEEGETDVRVDRPDLFLTGIGRYRNRNEDVGLCLVDEDGRPDWHRSEQVELVSVDRKKGVIRVRRGRFGTSPREFPAGSYAAAHAHEGPWGKWSNLMWFYNYSTRCPRDGKGRMCADVHAEELAGRFSLAGALGSFDGLEFDVLHHTHARRRRPRGLDCDADGKADDGVFGGVNTYGAGVVEFCRTLREKLGRGKLILADGMSSNHQRAFGILNGIESEGWPHLSDWELADWSGGMNRHLFWAANGREPVFNYVNHKFVTRGDAPGVTKRPDVPWSIHRLVFAAAVFTDSAICYAFAPPKEDARELIGVWDELRMGKERRPGWLGLPAGPVVRLAERRPDLLRGRGDPVSRDLLADLSGDLSGEGVRFEREARGLKVTPAPGVSSEGPRRRELRFRLRDVPADGPDLHVSVTARASPMRGYPREVARFMWVGIARPEGELTFAGAPEAGTRLRGGADVPLKAATGATVRWQGRITLAGETRSGFFVHPPYRGVKGCTFWERDVRVPEEGVLRFFLGMGPKSPERGDGVAFRVLVAGGPKPERAIEYRPAFTRLYEHFQKASKWTRHEVPLAGWAGKTVRLRFVSDCGPKGNTTADHSYWADAWVLGPRRLRGVTRAVRHMTWANERRFTSRFYFSDVNSKKVDLEFAVEGSEPVWITRIAARAHPDAMYREFERGVVLANPSPRPYVFDLDALFGGRALCRLKGTPRQDPGTNDGSPARGSLELGPKDAIFLVETGR